MLVFLVEFGASEFRLWGARVWTLGFSNSPPPPVVWGGGGGGGFRG